MHKKNEREIDDDNKPKPITMDVEEKIIQLLDGELDDQSVLELENIMADNPALVQKKELYQQIILAIQRRGDLELRKELDGILEGHLDQQNDSKIVPFKKYVFYGGIAASFLLILSFYFLADSGDGPMHLQFNEAPIHADSATYQMDSLQNIGDSVNLLKK